MNVFQTRKVLEAKMTDKCDIYRRKKVINENGSTDIILDPTPIATDVPCRISFIRYKIEDPSNIRIDENPIEHTPKIFLPVFTDIKAGDTVILRRISVENEILYTYKGIVGAPACFDTHIEIMLNIDTSA